MKKLTIISTLFLLFTLLFGACYHIPESDANMTFLLSPNKMVDGRFGRAVAMCGNYAFVGDANQDVVSGGTTYVEAGKVLVYKLGSDNTWAYLRTSASDDTPVAITAPDRETGDAFGSALYYAESSDGSKRMLFVTSLMVDLDMNGSGTDDKNIGAVYVYSVPTNVEDGVVFQAKISLDKTDDISDYGNLQDFLPDRGDGASASYPAVNENNEILVSKVNPGLGFGRTVRYDADSEVLVIGAPYESYYKNMKDITDATAEDNLVTITNPGAVYIFSPSASGVYTQWDLDERLMPMWYEPTYNKISYYNEAGDYLGMSVVDADSSTLQYDDRAGYNFGDNIAVNGDTVVVGVPGAAFRYYRASEAGENSGSKLFDEAGNEIAAPTLDLHKFTENNPGHGAVYVYKNDGSDNWLFKQRLDRVHPLEEFKDTRAGDYITSSDNFYQRDYFNGDQLGASVEIFQDYILAGMPTYEKSEYGTVNPGGIKITANYGDVGAIAFFKKDDNEEYQIPDSILEGPNSDDWANFGKKMVLHGNKLAVAAPYYDFQIFQKQVGAVYMFELSSSGPSATEQCSPLTTKELQKGWLYLGWYMDFSDTHLICGVPEFSLTIYYDQPYVQKYSLDRCGAIYFFKWQ